MRQLITLRLLKTLINTIIFQIIVLIKLLKKNKTKDALELVQAVRDGLDGNDLESAFDEAVEMWFDEHSEGSRGF